MKADLHVRGGVETTNQFNEAFSSALTPYKSPLLAKFAAAAEGSFVLIVSNLVLRFLMSYRLRKRYLPSAVQH